MNKPPLEQMLEKSRLLRLPSGTVFDPAAVRAFEKVESGRFATVIGGPGTEVWCLTFTDGTRMKVSDEDAATLDAAFKKTLRTVGEDDERTDDRSRSSGEVLGISPSTEVVER